MQSFRPRSSFIHHTLPRACGFVSNSFQFNSATRLNMVIRPIMTSPDTTIIQPRDPNTLSNYTTWRTQHVTADLEIDFQKQVLTGAVTLRMRALRERSEGKVTFDTSFLDVKDVKVDGKKAKWEILDRLEPYGSPLNVYLGVDEEKGKEIEVEVTVSTTERCTALQWMEPEQTSNKKHPYMFSQCQAIHARSIFPCQDTPDVKATVDFNIRSPLPVVASGLPTGSANFLAGKNGKSSTLLYTFKQEVPMPIYLFALASGDLASASIGPRSVVVTGPEELVGCKWELEADMEAYMEAAEKIVYPYAWGTYNVLVLPASFPYGGMENPVFTFATPTIISKDRQNVDVIAHELSHSWSGNLVSNASWEHFWLNEGWTTYLERRIQMAIHGNAHRDFSAIIGWKALQDSVEKFGKDHEFTKLVIDLKGKDPDDAFSSVPYEKGFTFLYFLEKLVGIEKWNKFIPHYFNTYKFKSVDSYEFKSTLLDFFASDSESTKKLTALDWDTWFYKPGYPPKPDFDTSMVDACYALAEEWKNRSSDSFEPKADDISSWMANQSVVFLEKIQTFDKPLRPEDVELMGKTYGYDKSENVELVSRYFGVGLAAKTKSVYEPTAELLGKVGRMKFVRPLYKGLEKCDRELALKTFEKNRNFYHPICRGMVEKDLYGK